MKKAIVFGATPSAKSVIEQIKKTYYISYYCDNDSKKWGTFLDDKEIISPDEIKNKEFDVVVIVSLSALYAIKKQLLAMGIAEGSIITSFVETKVNGRIEFVKCFAKLFSFKNSLMPNEGGVIAEAGVFQGEFAAVMNEAFPAKTLHLFDTFEGFDARDVVFEEQYRFSDAKVNHLNITSEDLVLSKMKYPKNVEIRKGYFPDTAVGINEQFVLVNLDMDLYKPTLEGLKFFYPKMVKGGVIIVHDFFSDGYAGVNQAVKEFVEENGDVFFKCFPIGDGVSLAIQK